MANVTADQAPAGLISDPSAHAIAVAPFAGGNSGYTTHVILTQVGLRDGAGLLPTNASGQGFDLWLGAGDAGASGRGGSNFRRVGLQHTTGGNGVDSLLDASGNQIIVTDPTNRAWYLYNTSNTDHVSSTSGPTNFERLGVVWSGNVCTITTSAGGTGTTRELRLLSASALLGLGGSSTISWYVTSTQIASAGDSQSIAFGATTDTRIRRNSAGVLLIDNNSTGGGFIRTNPTTVSGLPAAATAGAGARGWVTDANATTYGSIVAGGGSNGVPVYSDGTNWRIG